MSNSCDPMDCSPPGSSAHGNLQARILEWVAISFPRGSSRPRNWSWLSCIADRLFTNWAMREAQDPGSRDQKKKKGSSKSHVYQCVCVCVCARLCLIFGDPMDCNPPGSSVHGISQQECWSGLSCPPPGDLPHPGIKPESPALAGGFFATSTS